MGSDDEKVLSQADVDALVALVPDKSRAAAPTISAKSMPVDKPVQPSVTETVQTSALAYQPPSSNAVPSNTGLSIEVIALQKTVADLTRQVSKFTGTAQRLDLLEERTGHLAQLIQHSSHNEQPSGEQIAEIQAQLWELSQQLKNRHELREDFQCAHCKSKGTMSILTKCTSCGQERWFGWWPKKKIVRVNNAKPL